jgi:equilibrative nucleoside transporter 1/2/3
MTSSPSTTPQPSTSIEMDRLRSMFAPADKADEGEFQPLIEDSETGSLDGSTYTVSDAGVEEVPFSWAEYCIFVLLGVAMLWSW